MSSPADNISEEERRNLIDKAMQAKELAYCPYSNFRVGAALLTKTGRYFTGCNVENDSYSPTICAERTAVVKAVSEGEREFKAIAVASDKVDSFIRPCGVCRQVLAQFSPDMAVFMTKADGSYEASSVGVLLPYYTKRRE